MPNDEQRTFMEANVDQILAKVYQHFDINMEMLKNKSVVLVDDSLVRGNVTKGLIKILRTQAKVKKIHVRILCPQIDKPCYLGINTRDKRELLSYQCGNDIKKIRAYIGADSLAFLSASGLIKAITNDERSEGFCLGCMFGHKPPIGSVVK